MLYKSRLKSLEEGVLGMNVGGRTGGRPFRKAGVPFGSQGGVGERSRMTESERDSGSECRSQKACDPIREFKA